MFVSEVVVLTWHKPVTGTVDDLPNVMTGQGAGKWAGTGTCRSRLGGQRVRVDRLGENRRQSEEQTSSLLHVYILDYVVNPERCEISSRTFHCIPSLTH